MRPRNISRLNKYNRSSPHGNLNIYSFIKYHLATLASYEICKNDQHVVKRGEVEIISAATTEVASWPRIKLKANENKLVARN